MIGTSAVKYYIVKCNNVVRYNNVERYEIVKHGKNFMTYSETSYTIEIKPAPETSDRNTGPFEPVEC